MCSAYLLCSDFYFNWVFCFLSASMSVAQWYSGKHILLTGGTGFMGKVLVEKLLRSCDVEKIYLIIRPKRGVSPDERLQSYFKVPLFDKIREFPNSESYFSKLCCISGDVMQSGFGITEEDNLILKKNVDLVFHMAAYVKFHLPLKNVVTMNLGGTFNTLEMAKSFEKLQAFVHVSTAYCHVKEEILYEKIYPAPHKPLEILEMMKGLDDEAAAAVAPHLIGHYPNAYAYTKCLTEELVSTYSTTMPIAILRPSMVTASLAEPIPGWVDNLNGPTGLLVGVGKGAIRTMLCDPNNHADMVPVDITTNRIIVATKELAEQKITGVPMVVNLTCDTSNPIRWGDVLKYGTKHFRKYPFSVTLWYQNGTMRTNALIHFFAVLLLHTIPAHVVDIAVQFAGVKPFLVKAQRKIARGLEALSYYTARSWQFKHDNIVNMYQRLTPEDKAIFNCDMSNVDWDQYILDYVLGARRYTMHEEPDQLPAGRKLLKRLYLLHCFSIAVVVFVSTLIVSLILLLIYNPGSFIFAANYLHIFLTSFTKLTKV